MPALHISPQHKQDNCWGLINENVMANHPTDLVPPLYILLQEPYTDLSRTLLKEANTERC